MEKKNLILVVDDEEEIRLLVERNFWKKMVLKCWWPRMGNRR